MWSLAYFLWTDPAVIIDNMYVNIVGQAMQLVSDLGGQSGLTM